MFAEYLDMQNPPLCMQNTPKTELHPLYRDRLYGDRPCLMIFLFCSHLTPYPSVPNDSNNERKSRAVVCIPTLSMAVTRKTNVSVRESVSIKNKALLTSIAPGQAGLLCIVL